MERLTLKGASGLKLAADVAGNPDGQPIIMLHGGGQTRHSWGELTRNLGASGYRAMTIDLRGHGDSEWCPDKDYRIDRFVDDVHRVIADLDQPPVLIGASLGGISALLAAGESPELDVRGLVLVDIVPQAEKAGIQRIRDFMLAHLDGFDSIDDVIAAVSAYNPHRKPSSGSGEGLRKNLRVGADNRLYWHWDPAFMGGDRTPGAAKNVERLRTAARQVQAPTLLVRGKMSDVVSDDGVRDFLELMPNGRAFDVSGAGHMVSGDQNDAFNDAILEFLAELEQTAAPA